MEAVAGLAGLGFWLFLAAVVVSGVWFDARKRESQQETLRRLVESGQELDVEVIDRMMANTADREKSEKDLKVGGIIMMFVAMGLTVLGWFLSRSNDEIFWVLLGVSLLVFLIGTGLFVAGVMTARWQRQD